MVNTETFYLLSTGVVFLAIHTSSPRHFEVLYGIIYSITPHGTFTHHLIFCVILDLMPGHVEIFNIECISLIYYSPESYY